MKRLAVGVAAFFLCGLLVVVIDSRRGESDRTETVASPTTVANATPGPATELDITTTTIPGTAPGVPLEPEELDLGQQVAPEDSLSQQPATSATTAATAVPAPTSSTETPTEETTPPSTAAAATELPPLSLSAQENLDLLMSHPTRNTQFDNNPFKDVPSNQISVANLTVNEDIYGERLLSTQNSAYFRTKCEVSHFGYDDPIVFPGEPGRSHLHMYFGNTKTNAFSTYESLMNSGTGTCNGEDLNRTAYWVPALLDRDGNALIPYEVMVYYKNDNYTLNGANELVSPFPANLRMIAGDTRATSPQTQLTGVPGSLPIVSFSCGPAYASNNAQPLLPDCSGSGNSLEIKVAFQACHNEGAGSYQADQSHVSYPDGGYYAPKCPGSHTTDLSSIMYRIFYSPADYGGSLEGLHLSSDVRDGQLLPAGTTMHADWFGAWHREAMDLWVANCNNTHADCETGLLGTNPAVSMVKRKQGFYERGYRAPAAELIKLCPGKTLDTANPVVSVSHCR